ncbi:hypothetical protein A2954_00975 [Candidatus Roizmanbacteria bacterium RIFCSPLOWO2_01_FULL_37_12]|uniref:Antitoxin n=1 Tax=Candidatus Roizmanbacteria bacterium RIFCSPLOWO2_01_FULL_37_12 TaxID=1802056 RepID=A0A1F7IGB7_9BACT|nr:MAG: hypothetical protein A3D76_00200 [Candidatus Roizmanbacteria bacterium RIFCSPHIGHO2_02_FULL_37_9b]OGK42400.1 MAG: hypothetical protein A2954_00975 [Candidatus Roizmanbacteria bacterium RIFCSPLOWO2_01_FULL_37_12]
MKSLTITSLRENLFKIVDQVIVSGMPQEIERKGKKLKIVLADKVNKLDNLVPHKSIRVNPEKLINAKPYSWKEAEKI